MTSFATCAVSSKYISQGIPVWHEDPVFPDPDRSVECITEALNVLKQWNPNWNLPFFLSDFSDVEYAALKGTLPDSYHGLWI